MGSFWPSATASNYAEYDKANGEQLALFLQVAGHNAVMCFLPVQSAVPFDFSVQVYF